MIYGVEPPPDQFTHCEHTAEIQIVRNPNWDCRQALGELGGSRRYLACYVPETNKIVMPRFDASLYWSALLYHEYGHECGWRHLPNKPDQLTLTSESNHAR